MCLPLLKYLCILFSPAGQLDRTGVGSLCGVFVAQALYTHTASTKYQILHTEFCSAHLFGKTADKWPRAQVTNLRPPDSQRETRDIEDGVPQPHELRIERSD